MATTTLPGAVWNPALLMQGPAGIQSQGVSLDFPLISGPMYPDYIPVEPVPVFQVETDSFDWFRVAMLALGILVGATLLRGRS